MRCEDDRGIVTLVDALFTLVILGAASAIIITQTQAPSEATRVAGTIDQAIDAGRLAALAPLVTIPSTTYQDETGVHTLSGASVGQLIAIDAALRAKGTAFDDNDLHRDIHAEISNLAGPGRDVAVRVEPNSGSVFFIPEGATPPAVRAGYALHTRDAILTFLVWEA